MPQTVGLGIDEVAAPLLKKLPEEARETVPEGWPGNRESGVLTGPSERQLFEPPPEG